MADGNLRVSEILAAWGTLLSGRRPLLSIEITRECPLRCPGCYAYSPEHLGEAGSLRQLSDFKGEALISRVLALIEELKPLHVSIVGGEPLVRYRELEVLLPQLDAMGLQVQLVTSAVRPIPAQWRNLQNLHLVVSIDGLAPEHDRRRAPATYDRILKHIAGHRLIVHCTITRQLLGPGYLEEFARFWSAREEIRKIWFSLYTPQEGEISAERLSPTDRQNVITEIERLRGMFPKIDLPTPVVEGLRKPPDSPDECIFAQSTTTISADMRTRIMPCQFGGRPVCSECGCMASAGLVAVGRHKLGGFVPVGSLFSLSRKIGDQVARV